METDKQYAWDEDMGSDPETGQEWFEVGNALPNNAPSTFVDGYVLGLLETRGMLTDEQFEVLLNKQCKLVQERAIEALVE